MGKYSLDAFERYPLEKLRPVMTVPERSAYRLVKWPGPAMDASGCGRQVLWLRLEEYGSPDAAAEGIRCAGERYGDAAVAVALTGAEAFAEEAVRRCCHYFPNAVLLAEPGSAVGQYCRREEMEFGLWLVLDREILALRRCIGENDLARQWEEGPVYICADHPLTEVELDAARRWHCTGANVPAVLGPRMTLRRMMFPRELTSGGVMPLRMWWQNLGTAPIYRNVRVRLELREGELGHSIAVDEEIPRPGLGDSTFNTIARLPRIPCGSYALWCGLELEGEMLPLFLDAPVCQGMYRIGRITLDDTPRPYLETMWIEQYADGYYPLEDPAQPE